MYKLTENFTLTAGIENITDQRYRPYSSGIVAPGKNIILAVRATL
jgi:hemoglobin/transferrin/lactoferrin receptor protein